jgi:hypothetical protein
VNKLKAEMAFGKSDCGEVGKSRFSAFTEGNQTRVFTFWYHLQALSWDSIAYKALIKKIENEPCSLHSK